MRRSFLLAAVSGVLFGAITLRSASAEEPRATGTVDLTSSVPDLEKLKGFGGTSVILGQKEWERLAAAWGIKEVARVDFSKELLLVGTWRGPSFKFLTDVKNGDLQVELVGDKTVEPGFRFRVLSISRAGITKFQGVPLPAPEATTVGEPKAPPTPRAPTAPKSPAELKTERPRVVLTGDTRDETLQQLMPANGVIVSDKRWEALAKAWSIADAPRVDFTKEVLVVGTSRGSVFDITPVVINGDLTVMAKGTKDLAPGFRWKIVSVPREGIKTVGGKELPQE